MFSRFVLEKSNKKRGEKTKVSSKNQIKREEKNQICPFSFVN